jgi:hypothetical protein
MLLLHQALRRRKKEYSVGSINYMLALPTIEQACKIDVFA